MVPRVAVLMFGGFQVPVMLLVEVVSKTGGMLPWHKGPIGSNSGITAAPTETVREVWIPHWPALGVNWNVKVPIEAVDMFGGFQVPEIPFVETAGRAGSDWYWHKGPIGSKVGMIWVEIVISMVVTVPQPPGSGVKV